MKCGTHTRNAINHSKGASSDNFVIFGKGRQKLEQSYGYTVSLSFEIYLLFPERHMIYTVEEKLEPSIKREMFPTEGTVLLMIMIR